ncbi:elongator complex protein 4 [Rhizodiscina lignyota]|uniref:Elongator complex protein 4 n=1 Tax=Rhizodiscina lignyota TaxID=1504668 RepID=A0A9P4MA04_9PEZI|nr:elongator complex protein 4 [Rhizodiscina lignyota]
MSFSKRSVPLGRANRTSAVSTGSPGTSAPGIRPSPITGQPTTSTGCSSLDALLAANAGLSLGTSLLIEETGTTDYASALLRCFAAEGILQGHQVHLVGVGDRWGRELPGAIGESISDGQKQTSPSQSDQEKMKIAWRYERLGSHGERAPIPSRIQPQPGDATDTKDSTPPPAEHFCHTFDFTKRLDFPPAAKQINYIPLSPTPTSSPFDPIITSLQSSISNSQPDTLHRLIIPSLLSPAYYPAHSPSPDHILRFLHSLRALLRLHTSRLTAMLSLPLSLHPRSTGLTRWIERLVDGVAELQPFPHTFDASTATRPGSKEEEKPQGMVRVHALPVFTERGGGEGKGVAEGGDDLCFVVSRRKFLIRAFNLPPVEGDTEAQGGQAGGKDMEF